MEYVINTEQKQTVTGVRNYLWQKLQKMNPATMAITYVELEELVQQLETVVEPLDEKDNEQMGKLIDYYRIYEDAREFESTWSMWKDPTGKEERVWMEKDHPYAEGCVIEYSPMFGKTIKVAIEGSMWIDVWNACDKLIRMSGSDNHHTFIEDLNHVEFGKHDKRLVLQTGS